LAERRGEVIYLAIPLRNVGTGLAVLQAYDLIAEDPVQRAQQTFEAGRIARSELAPRPVGEFRLQQRDFYIASGDTGFWQAALRDPSDEQHAAVARTLERSEGLSIDLLYGDHEGGQQTVSRFNLVPGEDGWFSTDSFHWVLGAADPRESA
jgi:hypothetical protein